MSHSPKCNTLNVHSRHNAYTLSKVIRTFRHLKMAPRTNRGPDRAKPAAAGGKRKLDFMQEEDDDDYEIVRGSGRGGMESDEDEAGARDISSMLVGGSGPGKQTSRDDGYGTEEEEAEIASMMGSKLKADGMTAVKAHAAKGKGKEKETKGLTGGGSWQSMGELSVAFSFSIRRPIR